MILDMEVLTLNCGTLKYLPIRSFWMFDWKKVIPVLGLLVIGSGCNVVSNKKVSTLETNSATLMDENAALRTKLEANQAWRKNIIFYEDKVNRLETIVEPLAPLTEKNMELMATNAREGEEAGGGALSEVFYLVQTAYSELDVQAANVANAINSSFNRDDFVQTFLYDMLEDKVVDITISIAEVVNRRSNHMATDRRLVTARLKALNECFLALSNLSLNKAFDLSYNQRGRLLEKADEVRVEYAKTLKTDFFPAIPHFVPMATGEDYLKGLEKMTSFVTLSSVFYNDPNGKKSTDIFSNLRKDLQHKKDILNADRIK